jgi:hypothetical protein
MSDSSELLRVKSIKVDGLFDLFDHQVDLNLVERVTVLHGPNGVGKTMLLRLANALLDGRLSLFQRVPFREFVLVLSDDRAVSVTPGPASAKPERRSRKGVRRASDPPPMLHLQLMQGERLMSLPWPRRFPYACPGYADTMKTCGMTTPLVGSS